MPTALFKIEYRLTVLGLKLHGCLPGISMAETARMMVTSCEGWPGEKLAVPKSSTEPSRFVTPFGEVCSSPKARKLLGLLALDMIRGVYEKGDVRICEGDVVFDLGSHLGTFTRYALSRGAGKVIAFEPEPSHLAFLKQTFSAEIESGRVHIVECAAWRETATLRFSCNSVLSRIVPEGGIEVAATTVDAIAEKLQLRRVDFIKADIEGAERHALEGARSTIQQFRPRLAICIYHLPDDPVIIANLIKSFAPYLTVTNTGRSQVFAHVPALASRPQVRRVHK
jgi:FkbM family methyltransferase